MLSSDPLQPLDQLGEAELRTLAQELIARLSHADGELHAKERKLVWSTARIKQLTHEIAVLKRWKFSARSEPLDATQKSLLDEDVDADIAAVELELASLRSTPQPTQSQQPRRAPLPAHLPRTVVRHEPESTTCACGCALKRFGEDISEKLDDTPGVFTVERHIRGKCVSEGCAAAATDTSSAPRGRVAAASMDCRWRHRRLIAPLVKRGMAGRIPSGCVVGRSRCW